MKDSFWSGGPAASLEGLREHYEPLIESQRRRLTEFEDVDERRSISRELAETQAEYATRRRSIGRSLF